MDTRKLLGPVFVSEYVNVGYAVVVWRQTRQLVVLELRKLLRQGVVIAAVALVCAFDFSVLHANSATAGFTFLVLILGLATRVGLRESIIASIVSVAAYNFFFLPPVGSFTIADPQNWVALLAFLATAVTASRLSSTAREQAEEARARQEELQRMYDFSRGLILGKEDYGLALQVIKQVVESFEVGEACFYDSSSELITRIDSSESAFEEAAMIEAAMTGRIWRNPAGTALIVPVRLGGASLGSLGISGDAIPSEIALQAIAQLVAIAIERARVQEVSARMEATQQNEQLKSTLLEALAHEFKTPLTSVKAATTTLLSSTLSASDERELVTIVDEEADRMNRLVSDSIELARIGTAPLDLHKESLPPEELIFSALADLRGLLEVRDLKVEISPGLPLVLVDKHLSKLALRQLLNNALKYSPSSTEIRIEARRQDHFVTVSVSDLGPGIKKADQARIFEKFYRGPDVRAQIPGTGMGLSITRDIVESQGGAISLQSEPGRGATFSVTFPVSYFSGLG